MSKQEKNSIKKFFTTIKKDLQEKEFNNENEGKLSNKKLVASSNIHSVGAGNSLNTTIPFKVVLALGLKAGDTIIWRLIDNNVTVEFE